MRILLIGSGGREHALAKKMTESALCEALFIAPGNPGTAQHGENVPIDWKDFSSLRSFILQERIGLVVVGPEDPLVDGLRDRLEADAVLRSVLFIGPGQSGARLEGSKDFSKEFMARHGIPTAGYASFTADTLEQGFAFLETLSPPYVLKADGLAAGKGVLILSDVIEAKKELRAMVMDAKFGAASSTVVIEEFLNGIEFSVFALTNGQQCVLLPEAKDYKRIGEGDTGLNTGGMGAVSPVPFCTPDLMEKVVNRIIHPTVKGLHAEGIPYTGFLFFGLIVVDKEPFVIEYNCRMGDPETEVVFPRITEDVVALFVAAAQGTLQNRTVAMTSKAQCAVVSVAEGYPEVYAKGDEIHGLDENHAVSDAPNSIVFHAGTSLKNGQLVTRGGRVLVVSSQGDTLNEALSSAFGVVKKVTYRGQNYRRDIGKDVQKWIISDPRADDPSSSGSNK